MPGGIGRGAFGGGPWGGAEQEVLNQNPSTQFDLFCFEHCDPMLNILSDTIITVVDAGGQFPINYPDAAPPPATTCDLGVLSGEVGNAAFPTANAIITAEPTSGVPNRWTTEWIFEIEAAPSDFGDLVNRHLYLGSSDAAGPVAGLFISKMGLAYTGSIHHVSGNLVVDAPLQFIPNTANLVQEGVPLVCRVASDGSTGVTYIFFTTVADALATGQTLIAVLPSIDAADVGFPPTDRSIISARGTTVRPTRVAFDKWCMASTVLIANLPPVADAGGDQAVRICSIAELDGTGSFDPEGVPVLYSWRLINGPVASSFVEDGNDGATFPQAIPTGFTDKFHSPSLQAVHNADNLQSGDVLFLDATAYDIVSTGTDANGFFALLTGDLLADGLSGKPYKVLRQRGLSNPTTAKPTFFPDVLGFYQFDLIVSDGALESATSVAVINVVDSPLPRGITPNLEFIFNYLSDYWDMVEERDVIATYWSALAQVAATELLTAWQHDYAKSLRDIQRTFIRRWLHYDLVLGEPLSEITTIRTVFGGVSTSDMDAAGEAGVAGTSFVLSSGVHSSRTVNLVGTDPVTAPQLAANLLSRLLEADPRYTVQVISRRGTGDQFVRVNAPFPFTISSSSLPVLSNGVSGIASGTGTAIGNRTYRLDTSAQGLGLQEDDLLILGAEAYRISEIADDPSDDIAFQRVILKEDFPTVGVSEWSISGYVTSELLDFYNGLVIGGDACFFEVVDMAAPTPTESTTTLVQCEALGVPAGRVGALAFDPAPLAGAHALPDQFTVRLARVVRRTYLPIDSLIEDIPTLRENIELVDDEKTLRRNLDFFLEEFRGRRSIRFVSGAFGSDDVWEGEVPPDRLWAEYTYADNRPTIEDNFGVLAEVSLDQIAALPGDVDYLSAVRGIWYAYMNGPTVFNLRVGAQILLGLPFAEQAGSIVEIRTDFSPTQGRILIRDTDRTEIVRSYTFPRELALEVNPTTGVRYAEGDTVTQFAPLVEGVDVVDYVKEPTWFQGLLNQGIFLEVEKFHRFVVRVDSAAFDLSALLFVRDFILKIKPVHTYPLFLVQVRAGATTVSIVDTVINEVTLRLADSVCSALPSSTSLDDARPGGGGYWNQLDADATAPAPTYPTPDSPIEWGLDAFNVCPSDVVTATCCEELPGPNIPLDSCFALDSEVTPMARFSDTGIFVVPTGATGLAITEQSGGTVPLDGTITMVRIVITDGPGADPDDYELVVAINGSDDIVEAFTSGPLFTDFSATVAEAVTAGDVITARVRHSDPGSRSPDWTAVRVDVKTMDSIWTLDQVIPAGTYCGTRTLS